MPNSLATSSKPPRPKMVFTFTRMKLLAVPSARNCSKLFTNDHTSDRLPKKLLTPVRTGVGVTSTYAVATGFRMAASTSSLKRVMLRL